jgi:hypothetical protein
MLFHNNVSPDLLLSPDSPLFVISVQPFTPGMVMPEIAIYPYDIAAASEQYEKSKSLGVKLIGLGYESEERTRSCLLLLSAMQGGAFLGDGSVISPDDDVDDDDDGVGSESQKKQRMLKNARRAKSNLRKKIKELGCDRMATFGVKYDKNDITTYMTRDDFVECWERFRRLCKSAGVSFNYMAVLEPHLSGSLHMHVAVDRFIDLNTALPLWKKAISERTKNHTGSIQLSYLAHLNYETRCRGIAKYLSKYLAKNLENVELYRNSYWGTKCVLPRKVRVIISAVDLYSALAVFCKDFGFSFDRTLLNMFEFNLEHLGGKGCWGSLEPCDILSSVVSGA